MTFNTDTVDPVVLEATLCHLAERAGYGLRRSGMTAGTVSSVILNIVQPPETS